MTNCKLYLHSPVNLKFTIWHIENIPYLAVKNYILEHIPELQWLRKKNYGQ